ncbi:hypothetical protein JR316_0003263 [Psilocybe cubensis]|uniref:Uncharacterized protein n=1 Tax=Psilocybe cubensis TaxID=181762 RepID=A0ACB8H798_PSICU|nr:hypothetical protein JR316_0003263 [Psilocybe cubensis]KAH9483786.1 hypothetical protein JR316_0003263 [Psilocybe cubensis]
MSKEKDWAASLGEAKPVLRCYATFGKLSEASTATTATEPVETAEAAATPSGDTFIPSRRVRTVPGGPHTDIFDHGDEGDALSQAPPRAPDARPIVVVPASAPAQVPDNQHVGLDFTSEVKPSRRVRENPGGTSSLANFWDSEETPEFKPTRRVREGPGGRDNISEGILAYRFTK